MSERKDRPQTPAASSRSAGWFVLAAVLVWLGIEGPRIGFRLAEDAGGTRYLGFIEGHWFVFLGIVFLTAAWTMAYRAAHRALWGRER